MTNENKKPPGSSQTAQHGNLAGRRATCNGSTNAIPRQEPIVNDDPIRIFRRRRTPFFTVYSEFVKGGWNATLTPSALRVFNVLSMHADNTTGESFPSYKRIAEYAGVNRRVASDAINELEAWGLVEVRHRFSEEQGGRQTSNEFRLTEPDEWRTEATWKTRKGEASRELTAPQCTLGCTPPVYPRVHPPQCTLGSPELDSELTTPPPTSTNGGGDPPEQAEAEPEPEAEAPQQDPVKVDAIRHLAATYYPGLNRLEHLIAEYDPDILGPSMLAIQGMEALNNPCGYLHAYVNDITPSKADQKHWRQCIASMANGKVWTIPVKRNGREISLDEWRALQNRGGKS